jgi:hypothetical protein
VQDVALVLDHVNVEVPPVVIDVGFATRVTVGTEAAGLTVIVALADTLVPSAPVQVRVYVVVLVGLTLLVPVVASMPVQPPLVVQDVAPALDHVNVEVPPAVIVVGFATKLVMAGDLKLNEPEPMQPVRLPKTRPKARARTARSTVTFMKSPRT